MSALEQVNEILGMRILSILIYRSTGIWRRDNN